MEKTGHRQVYCKDCSRVVRFLKLRINGIKLWKNKTRRAHKKRIWKIWYEKNKNKEEFLRKKNKAYKNWAKKNPNYQKSTKRKKYQREYMARRRKLDVEFNLRCRLTDNLYKALRKYTQTGKIWSSKKYGIDYNAIIEHLKPFPKNIQDYDVDHIKPLCSFNLSNKEEVKKAFYPKNLQWLLSIKNKKKGGKCGK